MSVWDALGHFFRSIFPHNAKEAQALLTDISPYVNLAGPIVQDVEMDLKPLLSDDQVRKAEALNAWLSKYIHNAGVLETTVNQLLAETNTGVVLRDAAKAALTMLLPASASLPLNLIVETAYQLYVVKAGLSAPPASTPTPVPVTA